MSNYRCTISKNKGCSSCWYSNTSITSNFHNNICTSRRVCNTVSYKICLGIIWNKNINCTVRTANRTFQFKNGRTGLITSTLVLSQGNCSCTTYTYSGIPGNGIICQTDNSIIENLTPCIGIVSIALLGKTKVSCIRAGHLSFSLVLFSVMYWKQFLLVLQNTYMIFHLPSVLLLTKIHSHLETVS